MQNIRHSVFETNSSSTHSISISRNTKTLVSLPTLHGEVHIGFGEFGWEQEKHYDAATKAAYIATYIFNNLSPSHNGESIPKRIRKMFEDVIKTQTGAKKVVYDKYDDRPDAYDAYGYIDHQSTDGYVDPIPAEVALKDAESLRMFLFNPDSYVETDNDNH